MNDVALVTGGARRLGREICLMLAEEGCDIALHYHSSHKDARRVKDKIEEGGRRCLLVQGDLTDRSFYRTLIETVFEAFGTLSVLVNNASIFERIDFKQTTPDVLDRHFLLHLHAPFFLSQWFAKHSANGVIINVLDSRVSKHSTEYLAYGLTKQSLRELTLLMAKVLGPRIRVNGICPGPILPPENQGLDYLNALAEKIPLKRPGSVSDVLRAIRYLKEAPYVTGDILFVDGGEQLI
ncbi:MAG: SDR family oxidoreductase [Nitrospiria bacterium]